MPNTIKGPWKLHPTLKDAVVSDSHPYSVTICDCSGYKYNREANALLISCAPEMLSALLECEVLLEDYPVIKQQVIAIIKKAKGDQP